MKNVPRYECEQSIQGGKPIANFKLSETGGWVHFSDIKEFLPTATQQANCAMPKPSDIPSSASSDISAWDSNGDLW